MSTIMIQAKDVVVTVFPPSAVVIGDNVTKTGDGIYSIHVGLFEKAYTVQLDGFDTEYFRVNLQTNATLKCTLKPNRKTVTITTTPDDAKIKVDGEDVGTGVGKFIILKGESKSVKISAYGYDTYVGQVNFADQRDINNSYEIALIQNEKNVTITVDVESADFYLDGVQCGKGKSATVTLKKGQSYNLLIRSLGYRDCIQKLDFSMEGNNIDLTSKLTKDASFTSSEDGGMYANIPLDVTLKTTDHIGAIRRVFQMLTTQGGFTLAKQDHVLGFYQTVWNLDKFDERQVRTRVTVTELPDMEGNGLTKYSILVESQEADPKAPNVDESFKKWDRILKRYADVARNLKSLENMK